MAIQTMSNALILLIMASSFNVTYELVLPNLQINTSVQPIFSAIEENADNNQNGIINGHKIKYNIEELKNDKNTDDNVENDTVGRNSLKLDEDSLKGNELLPEWNIKMQQRIHNIILHGGDLKRNKHVYDIDANAAVDKVKGDISISNERISSIETSSTDNLKEVFHSDKLAVHSVAINKHIQDINVSGDVKKDKTERENSSTLNAKAWLNDAMSAEESKRLEVDTNFSNFSAGDFKDYGIQLSLKTSIGTYGVGTSKTRIKRDDGDDDLYIWESCEGTLHLDYVNGKFQCVEVSLDNRINFGPLDKCPAGHRRVFISNILKLCQPRRKRHP